jgi:hypothetical protein
LPFSIDIGTSEKLELNANGGDDQFSAGDVGSLISITVNGGAGNDTLLGATGADTLNGDDGNDFVDGNGGADVSALGAGDDPTDIAVAQSTTIGPGRHVKARDLHPGDIMQRHDWSLHVLDVKIGPKVVAVAVTEFGFELHYAADETLHVAI